MSNGRYNNMQHRSPIWRYNDYPTHDGRCEIIYFRLISDFTCYIILYYYCAVLLYRIRSLVRSRELPKRAEFSKNWVFFRFSYYFQGSNRIMIYQRNLRMRSNPTIYHCWSNDFVVMPPSSILHYSIIKFDHS